MNALLENISHQAAEDLQAQIKDSEKDLLAAIHKAEQESQLQESPLKFNIGFRISVDFEKSCVTNTLSWSVKQSLETSHKLEDPSQVKLPLEESTVTIKTGGESVTVTEEQFHRAVKRMAGKR